MYKNVGKQIQKLAHVIRIVEIIFGVLLAFSTLSFFASSGDALTGVLTANQRRGHGGTRKRILDQLRRGERTMKRGKRRI